MDINFSDFDFSTVIQHHLEWLEDYAKNFELNRRIVAASAVKSEEERKRIEDLWDAFTYMVVVEGNSITLERVPATEADPIGNDIVQETNSFLQTILPDAINHALSQGSFINDVTNAIKPKIEDGIKEMLGGVF